MTSPQHIFAYEVSTIKSPDPNGYASPLRVYIQRAYGIPVNSIGWVIGPDWIDSARYVIQGKASDETQKAMQTMTAEEQRTQEHLMMQGLLADRFGFKAHFETREMPVYQLVVAKGGSKLKETSDSVASRIGVGASLISGKATSIQRLADALESVPDIGGRIVIDKTELAGKYDFLLKWTPLQATAPSDGSNGAALQITEDASSVFTAIQEQLGLRLILTRGPGQVLFIDHIDRPSAN